MTKNTPAPELTDADHDAALARINAAKAAGKAKAAEAAKAKAEETKKHPQTNKPVIQASPATSKAPALSKAEQRAADKAKAKAKAEAEKAAKAKAEERVKAAAAKAAEKAKKEAEKKEREKVEAKAFKEAEGALKSIGVEVLKRMELAKTLDGKADDHRLAAALKLAEAKKLCEANKISFKEWSDEHAEGLSYETVRKLASVGGAENPVLALADMRGKNKDANKEARAKKAAEKKAADEAKRRDLNVGDDDEEADDTPRPTAAQKAVAGTIAEGQDWFLGLDIAKQVAFLNWGVEQVEGLKLVAVED